MKSRIMKSLFRGSMATLIFASALLAAPLAFAQTEPRESDPVYPCPPDKCPSTTPGCSAMPGAIGASGAALAPVLFGLALLARRRRNSTVG